MDLRTDAATPSTDALPRRRLGACTRALGAAIAVGFFAGVASAQEIVSASPDITIALGAGVVTTDEDVAVDNQLGIVVLENLGTLPVSADVIGIGVDLNGDRLFTVDTTVDLGGGVIARPGDVVRYDGASHSIEFDASAAGVPTGVATDAASLSPNGLLLSFDTTVDLGGGLIAADEDLVEWNGASFSMALDGSAAGVPVALDADAAQAEGGGYFLVSFDTAGQLGGVTFADEDVLRWDGSAWSMFFDADAADADWGAADLDAVLVPEPGFAAALGLAMGSLLGWAARRR